MPCEIGLRFDDSGHVVVFLNEDGQIQSAPAQSFTGPLDEKAQRDLKWYLEVYPVQYTTDIDDERAAEIGQCIQGWGEALFETVFADREAERLFNRFQDERAEGRLLTVSSGHPAVLAQPWELLRDPKGTYLFLDQPRISVRRRLSGSGGGRRPFGVTAKERLHMLFVVSRPNDAGFIDPRADPQAVMDAIDAEAPGRVTYEFLRPATVGQLIRRLDDKRLAPIDVLHFDGHGVYDSEGGLAERARQAATASGASHVLREAPATEAQQGYLWFENDDGSGAPVAAARLGDLLYQKQVGLIVLSACQSAMVGGEDPMGSVAARLIHAGLPSVLAMTHSVLVDTTRALFGHFYRELARGEPIGTSLDNARSQLYFEAARGERQRADQRITLNLQDWFLPALYQAGADTSLLREAAADVSASASRSNLRPQQESGFHGRRRELWDIERWFVGGTRRVVVSGFGGQGKTFLAEELGRWLPRTGMFSCACFVDYAAFQGSDPVGLAVSTLGTVLGQSLLDADAATNALMQTPTLLILDNLEALDPKALDELLSAAAVWSDAGTSRVLITTRANDLHHASFPAKDSNRCRYLVLQGLGPDDALDWFQELMRLPPEPQAPLPQREPLKSLFDKVRFHPLSVGMLARQLKLRRIAELGERLEAFLATEHGDPLLASLNLSLERLDPQSAQWLPRLGVFCGGALEKLLTDICEFDEAQWRSLRQGLEQTGLVQAESLQGVASEFLRFHPTLAPALWAKVPANEQERFAARHREAYYKLSGVLYHRDAKAVAATRQIARRELPNLLAAVHKALHADDPSAVDFAGNVEMVLSWFALDRDRAVLNERMHHAAGGEEGSHDWYLAQAARGGVMYSLGRHGDAGKIFSELMEHLGDAPSYDRCTTMIQLARCYTAQGQSSRAEAILRQALTEADRLNQTESTQQLITSLQADLGDTLISLGRYHEARAAHEVALKIANALSNDRAVAVSLGQLGMLALEQSDLAGAESRYRQALDTFRALGEPSATATCWHQLGSVYSRAGRFEEAEWALRESARIKEGTGDRVGAGRSWAQLALTLERANKPDEAEAWYVKALNIFRSASHRAYESNALTNLANLLASRPGRLSDASRYAEAALAIDETLDPTAREIWKTYNILAQIAQKQGDADAARAYRLKERASYAAAPVSRHNLHRWGPLIVAIVKAAADPATRAAFEPMLAKMAARNWTSLVGALRRLLEGEHDEDALCASLDREDSLIVATVLRGIADPATLTEILPAEPDSDDRNQED